MKQGLCHRLGNLSVRLQAYRRDQSVPQAYSEFIASAISLDLVYRTFVTLRERDTWFGSLAWRLLEVFWAAACVCDAPSARHRPLVIDKLFVDGNQPLHNIGSLRSTFLLQLPIRF